MQNPYLEVRASAIEGRGGFARQRIPKGTRIIEYLGKRITQAQANRLYGDENCDDEVGHVYLFTVSSRTIIDGGVDGNDARFINHSCEPNCESVVKKGRVYIEAIRTIEAGEELNYDYQLDIGEDVTEEDKQRYACLCGSASCRGTMLDVPKPKRARSKRAATEKQKAA
ncbi:MAG: SET domain-containing protein [Oxalobacter sp.]|nr:MAG: SET domain-containing protein [Oxalobacter sp.]